MKWCQKGGSCRAAALPQCYPNLPKTRLSPTSLYTWCTAPEVRGFCLGCMQKNSFIQISRQMMDNDENLILWSPNSHWNVWNSGTERREASKTRSPGWLQELAGRFVGIWHQLPIACSLLPLLRKKNEFTQDKWEQLITKSYSFYAENSYFIMKVGTWKNKVHLHLLAYPFLVIFNISLSL